MRQKLSLKNQKALKRAQTKAQKNLQKNPQSKNLKSRKKIIEKSPEKSPDKKSTIRLLDEAGIKLDSENPLEYYKKPEITEETKETPEEESSESESEEEKSVDSDPELYFDGANFEMGGKNEKKGRERKVHKALGDFLDDESDIDSEEENPKKK